MAHIPAPTDLTDNAWDLIAPLLPASDQPGRPRQDAWRDLLTAVFDGRRTGGQWRCLPHDVPPWKPASHHLRVWRKAGTWTRRHDQLRAHLRVALGREVQPSAGSIARQSVKTTGVGGERGFDRAQQLQGRERPLRVATEGLMLAVRVHPADVMDRDGVARLLPPEDIRGEFPRLVHVWLEAADNGQARGREWIERHLGWTAQGVKPPPRRVLVAADVEPTPRPAVTVLPRRWGVDRPFAGRGQNRRLSQDDERLCESRDAMVDAAMTRLMIRRLAPA